MSFLIVLASLCFLMFVAYRGYSVILFAPVAAMGAVLPDYLWRFRVHGQYETMQASAKNLRKPS